MEKQNFVTKIYKNTYVRFVFFGLCMCIVPLLTNAGVLKSSFLTIVGGTLIYTVTALGLNVLLGWSGLSSLGTAAFMGLGAYISAYVTGDMGMPWIVGVIAAIIISTILGIIVGLISLRMEGLYLGIITLCIAEIFKKTFEELKTITGSFTGKKAAYPSLFGYEFSKAGTYVVIAVILVLMMVLTYNIVNGQLGRALHAMRGSQVAAQAMGISILKYRLIAFAIAIAYAALGGVLYVHFIRFVYPSTWGITLSLNMLAICVIGGLRSIYGTFIGAVIVYALPDLVLKRLPLIGDINGLPYIISGLLIIIVVLFYPGGVVNLFENARRKVLKKKAEKKLNKESEVK